MNLGQALRCINKLRYWNLDRKKALRNEWNVSNNSLVSRPVPGVNLHFLFLLPAPSKTMTGMTRPSWALSDMESHLLKSDWNIWYLGNDFQGCVGSIRILVRLSDLWLSEHDYNIGLPLHQKCEWMRNSLWSPSKVLSIRLGIIFYKTVSVIWHTKQGRCDNEVYDLTH